jgi:hypothetical protein
MQTRRQVRITIRGRLSSHLASTFDGMTSVSRQGATDLVGEVVDQAHLYGLLARISDLGLELESVELHERREA